MKKKKCFQELNLSNAFIFALAMEDAVLCKAVLERILEFPIQKITVRTEKTMMVNPDYRGIRLDVYADDEESTLFNIEMQTVNQGDLPKRSRFHQSHMDIQTLRSGSHFRELKESYVIFICTFDPFGYGRYRYSFEEWCKEISIPLQDGTCKIFLNTEGKNTEDVPKELIQFLQYVGNSTKDVAEACEDGLLHKLHEKIMDIKKNGEKEVQYMTVQDWLDDMFFEGKQEGKAEGQIEILALMEAMIQDGKTADIARLSEDETFFSEMKKKYLVSI